jgi:predicted transcriptional regulator
LWPIVVYMIANRNERHINTPLSEDIIEQIDSIAQEQRRSRSRQTALLIELGLEEFNRRAQELKQVEEGQTQIDPTMVRSER